MSKQKTVSSAEWQVRVGGDGVHCTLPAASCLPLSAPTRSACCLLFLSLVTCRWSLSAAADSLAIKGTVKDNTGAALVGAKVTLTPEGDSVSKSTITAPDGAYLLTPLLPGAYTLEIDAAGFRTEKRPHIVLERTKELVLDFSLTPVSNREAKVGAAPKQAGSSGGVDGGGLPALDYYDQATLKPSQVKDSADAGGYSAAAYSDSYDLILSYVGNSEGPEPRMAGAGIQQEAGQPDRAETRASDRAPEQPLASREIAVDKADLEKWTESQFFSHGSDLLLHRDFEPAIDLLRHGVERYPSSVKLQVGLGIALYARGQFDESVRVLLRATDMVPSDPRPYLFLAKAYNVSRAQADGVTERLERLVELEPQDALAHYYYAVSLWKGKGNGDADLSRVEASLKRAAELDPRLVDVPLQLGTLYDQQAKYAEAVREYETAIKLKPDVAEAHYHLGQVLMQTGDRTRAQEEFAVYERLKGQR